jgi:hypothetical protein
MRCACILCWLEHAVVRLRTGRFRMGTLLIEQVLRAERERVAQENTTRPKRPARARKASRRARA